MTSLFPYHERILRMLHSHRPPERWLLKMPSYLFLASRAGRALPGCALRDDTPRPRHCHGLDLQRGCRVTPEAHPTWSPDAEFGPGLLEHWSEGMRRAWPRGTRSVKGASSTSRSVTSRPTRSGLRNASTTLPTSGSTTTSAPRWGSGPAANQRGSRGAHRYTAEEYGLDPVEINESFAPYLERFGALCGRAH